MSREHLSKTAIPLWIIEAAPLAGRGVMQVALEQRNLAPPSVSQRLPATSSGFQHPPAYSSNLQRPSEPSSIFQRPTGLKCTFRWGLHTPKCEFSSILIYFRSGCLFLSDCRAVRGQKSEATCNKMDWIGYFFGRKMCSPRGIGSI